MWNAARMDRATAIDVQELRAALELILNRIEEQLGPTVDLAGDYYWTVDARAAYETLNDPVGSLVAGQLSDDVNAIRELLRRDDDPIIWHDLAHVVGVLRRIATLDLP